MGHSSIDETEGTYGHLELERHEQRVWTMSHLAPEKDAPLSA
jgi:hypothetical protein